MPTSKNGPRSLRPRTSSSNRPKPQAAAGFRSSPGTARWLSACSSATAICCRYICSRRIYDLAPSPVENAADIERVIESSAREPNGGLVVVPGTPIEHRDLIIALTARHRLPAVYPFRFFVAAGGLMSYGTDFVDQSRQAASYVDRILRGANAADLPVQAPTKYETVLNLRTAKALGLDV